MSESNVYYMEKDGAVKIPDKYKKSHMKSFLLSAHVWQRQ